MNPPQHPRPARIAPTRVDWLPLCLVTVLVLGLVLVYQASAVTIEVSIDGQGRALRTHTGTVGDLVVEHRLGSIQEDRIVPHPNTRLRSGMHVAIQHARPVRVRADGRVLAVRSPHLSPMAILAQVGIALQPADAIKLNGRLWPRTQRRRRPLALAGSASSPDDQPPWLTMQLRVRLQAPGTPSPSGGSVDDRLGEWTVDVLRAVPITLVEDGIPYTVRVAGETVGEALESSGLVFMPEDELQPPADTPLSGPMRIVIFRSTPFTVVADGATQALRARAITVGQALERAGIPLQGHDYAVPAADTPLTEGLQIEVVRVVEEIQERAVEIPPGRVTQPDPAMALDETTVLQPGQSGQKRQRLRITYENGVVKSREVIEETVIQEPVAEIVAYGTQIVWKSVETEEGPKQYWRKLRMYATSYSPARSGTPKSAPWYGRSFMGFTMRKGIAGVDPHVIPLGMWLYVPGYGVAIAGDTGSGIRPYLIDLGYADDDYQSWHQYVDVYILERLPPEHQMPWILPGGQPRR